MLQQVELPPLMDRAPLDAVTLGDLSLVRTRIEAFHDRWTQDHPAQFVAADYELVYQALIWLDQSRLAQGKRFLEWGCGFAAVSCIANRLGWFTHAIEAHQTLIVQAKRTIEDWSARVDLFEGNFLPCGAEHLAHDPTLPSLGHGGSNAYAHWGLELNDFSLVYSYPWPGEDHFHEEVFDEYAEKGALFLMFIGPNEMRLLRKVN